MDKAKHVIISCVLTSLSYSYYDKNTRCNNDQAHAASVITVLSLGIFKEMSDEKFDWQDIYADLTGITIGVTAQ